MQLYGILSQYTVDLAFDWAWLRPVRRPMQEWLWRVPVPVAKLPPQVKVRLLLEDLGPTYVKLGQIISSQGRALPLEWEDELAKLQSEVRPFAYDDVRAIVTQSLGAPPETLYESFSPTPLAAASLAQVHEATTQDGRRVAVKVQRPNIHEQLRSDIKILTRGAAVLERRVDWAADADLTGVVREFGSTLLRELDYTIEAYNTRRLERVLAKIDGVHVPAVDTGALLGPRAHARVHRRRQVDRHARHGRRRARPARACAEPRSRRGADGHGRRLLPRRPAPRQRRRRARKRPADVPRRRHGGPARPAASGSGSPASCSPFATRTSRTWLVRSARSASPSANRTRAAFQREFEQRIGPLIDQPAGRTAPLQKLVSEAVDVLRDAGYRLDPQLTLAAKAVAQAEAITSALVPEADASDFAQLGGAALEELVPQAVNEGRHPRRGAQAGDLRRRRGGRAPPLAAGSRRSLGRPAREEARSPSASASPTSTAISARLESLARLIAAAILLTGLLIGSAIAATTGAGKSVFRTNVSDAALVVYVAATAVAATLVVVLLWRLVRPKAAPAAGARAHGEDRRGARSGRATDPCCRRRWLACQGAPLNRQ